MSKENKGLAKSMFNDWLNSLNADELRGYARIKHQHQIEKLADFVDEFDGFDSFIDFCMCKAVSLYLKKFSN